MYTYTKNDRTEQLNELCLALSRLIPIAEKYAPGNLQQYEGAKAEADFLLTNGFTQEELSTLSREVPDVVDRHRDWESQILEQQEDGTWCEPSWFVELEAVLQPALEAAGVLRRLGYY
ncbi:hypothetical protein [Halopseudomonas salina]|uniref:Uncharacterized protein n=1 Tax=Halopseudomonas salina TaxID=1323744 RepID=A0ABQ1Q5I9_9GAMM|nr:hypothetical protein [Halopseudomonas salina]GGD12714.1 hypothetical protein GCM10007418_34480 [Halopseudomonas salina]